MSCFNCFKYKKIILSNIFKCTATEIFRKRVMENIEPFLLTVKGYLFILNHWLCCMDPLLFPKGIWAVSQQKIGIKDTITKRSDWWKGRGSKHANHIYFIPNCFCDWISFLPLSFLEYKFCLSEKGSMSTSAVTGFPEF